MDNKRSWMITYSIIVSIDKYTKCNMHNPSCALVHLPISMLFKNSLDFLCTLTHASTALLQDLQ